MKDEVGFPHSDHIQLHSLTGRRRGDRGRPCPGEISREVAGPQWDRSVWIGDGAAVRILVTKPGITELLHGLPRMAERNQL